MGQLLIQDKEITLPGDEIAEGMDFIPAAGCYRDGEKVVAGKLGLISVDGRLIKIIPLAGRYVPKKGDTIICKVIDVTFSGWRVDTNSAYSAMLGLKDAVSDFVERGADLTKYYEINDYIVAKIINVTSQKLVDLTMKGPGLRKIQGGRIITVAPTKVPRIIGKQGSMVSMIKDATGCRIIVGQNGMVWIQGEPAQEIRAVEVIRKIEAEAHISGLTDIIKSYLSENKGENNVNVGLEIKGA